MSSLNIPNSLAQDRNLSYEARGLLLELLSRPDNREGVIAALQIPGKCGRDKLYRILKELIDAGYVERQDVRDENKRIVRGEYIAFYTPNRLDDKETGSHE